MADEVRADAGVSLRGLALAERAVIDALPHAVIVTDVQGRILLWNRPAETLYGWSEAEVLGCLVTDVLVPFDDRANADEIMAAMVRGESWRGDFTVLRRNGDSVRAYVIDTPIRNADGDIVAIVGASEDVTEQRLFEQHAADVAEHLALALDAGELGTWHWDLATGATTWDARLEALYALEPGTFAGTFDAYVSLLHPDEVASVLETVQRAINEKSRYTVEHRAIWPDGTVRWLQGKGQVTLSESGAVTGTMGCVADITDRVETALARERALSVAHEAAESERLSAQRLVFLGQINDALAASSTRADVMRNVTRAAVPMLGDWCAIYVLVDGSGVPEMEVAHVDPANVAYATELQQRFPYDPDAQVGVPYVIRTGRSEFFPEIDERVLDDAHVTEEGRSIVRSLRLRSAIAVPLVKLGRIIGALQFINTDASRKYTREDLALAEAVASRIAATLENRRLTEQQRMIAETLQASLLPDKLPTIPGIEVAVRYWASGEHTDVGGDFYDVFEVRDGQWAAVIGDVCGTGPMAASLTGLTRHTLRAAAWNGAEPDDVLRQLNHAMRQSGRDTFCTALYCTLDRTPHGFQLSVTAGGHPLPFVHRPNGQCHTIGTYGTVLGAVADSRSTTVAVDLQPGDAVVLYTDGITDVPPPDDLDIAELQMMISHAATDNASAEQIATALGNQIDAKLPFTKRDDDIALLILKVTGE
jgi:PAS domain S-box-containing protein